jgi:hypothetical protein
MVYSGFEYSTIFSQNYLIYIVTIVQFPINVFIMDYIKVKMDINHQSHIQMEMRTSYLAMAQHCDVTKAWIVDYRNRLMRRKNKHSQEGLVLSADSHLKNYRANKSRDLLQFLECRL